MKIFIIGISGTGKTPVAAKISANLGIEHIGASEYFRNKFKKQNSEDRNNFIEEITSFSLNELQKDLFINANYLKEKVNNIDCVIEGIRSPIDFQFLYKPGEDIVIFLDYNDSCEDYRIKKTTFETGINIIKDYLKWLVNNKLILKEKIHYWKYSDFYGDNSLESKIEEFLNDTH